MKPVSLITIALATVVGVSACATGPNSRTKNGAAAGAAIGAATGAIFHGHHARNAAIGAAVGALTGAGVGHYMDNQKAALNKQLATEKAKGQLDITQLGGGALKVGIASDYSFAVNKADLSFQAKKTYDKIANVLKDYNKTAVHVVGFTDSTGSAAYNMNLSKERAGAVAGYLSTDGVSAQRIFTWGRGETEPVASNDTKEGRAKNRRVDIVLKPIIQGQEQQAYTAPPPLGSS